MKPFGIASLSVGLLACVLIVQTEIRRAADNQAAQELPRIRTTVTSPAFDFGKSCAMRGVPAEANPFVGHATMAPDWLSGWMAGMDAIALQKAKAAEEPQ